MAGMNSFPCCSTFLMVKYLDFFAVWCSWRQHPIFREICSHMSEFPANSAVLKFPTFSKTTPDLAFGYLVFLRSLQQKKSRWSTQLFLHHDVKHRHWVHMMQLWIFLSVLCCIFSFLSSSWVFIWNLEFYSELLERVGFTWNKSLVEVSQQFLIGAVLTPSKY